MHDIDADPYMYYIHCIYMHTESDYLKLSCLKNIIFLYIKYVYVIIRI